MKKTVSTGDTATTLDHRRIMPDAQKQVQDAIDFAEKSPEPPPEALFEDVLVDTTSDAAVEAVAAD